MRKSSLALDDFTNPRQLVAREGGAVYLAERDGKFYVLQDESTFGDLLDTEDLAGLELQKTLEFDSASERASYLRERGWLTPHWLPHAVSSPSRRSIGGLRGCARI
ncbi:MAG TPA: hypothetical protein VFZ73_17530 [Gemmatimonadaceae bacterium]